ncbi:unnamed protein product, partial [Gongylonema pulchrum]|uniref:Syntaxin-6_N domain-containing protein n=1 Tax=Gongylonema pulchrum TaxID=637853 RepID=A0A183CVX9_9BILA
MLTYRYYTNYERIVRSALRLACVLVAINVKIGQDVLASIQKGRSVAAPAGSGCIPPRAEQRCYLTWRRSLRSERWGDEKAPKLILITNFVEQEISDTQTVTTRLMAHINETKSRAENEPPLMKFTFERKEEPGSPRRALSSDRFDPFMSETEREALRREQMLKTIDEAVQWLQ